ncbi:hypothetical protein VIBNIWn13_1090002 [Vibrio nigripulchritudo Wn13]|nr:hypothetical protein VIBNIBLFn1_260002 [Vibrio nigripulchritudo BLFn1]CCO51178.1 hypothetical protein VIBNIWn13_1090002 [Vibrio nigripulchritudo Wn13]
MQHLLQHHVAVLQTFFSGFKIIPKNHVDKFISKSASRLLY